MTNVGVHGIGVHFPSEIRTNEWWHPHVAGSWQRTRADDLETNSAHALSEGQRKVIAAMLAYADDPFHGSRTRHVLPDHLQPSDMEAQAGRAALEAAALKPADIDFLLQDGPVPDKLTVPNACIVHERLGLNETCMALSTGAGCNAFAMQMEVARALIATGAYQYGLLIQSSAMTRLVPPEARYSPWFGDGSTAVVVGPVTGARGLLASAHRTDGSLHDGMVGSVPGRRWYEDGRIWWHPSSIASARAILPSVADQARHTIQAGLRQAGLRAEEVDFYASHQATPWFRAVTQEHAGLSYARSLDTFPCVASISAANIPLVLSMAQQNGLLRDEDVVVTYSGGSGITWSSMVLRWGR